VGEHDQGPVRDSERHRRIAGDQAAECVTVPV
jgi:hypothetical protein